MTREQSEAWIDALDAYMKAREDRKHAARYGYSPPTTEEYEKAARETLIETMYPIVTGFAR